jgi:hypothetical protein
MDRPYFLANRVHCFVWSSTRLLWQGIDSQGSRQDVGEDEIEEVHSARLYSW